jgi:hypothetical protein
MNISGGVTLSGTVSASFTNGYLPAVGDSFAVLSYGSESGAFTSVLPTSIQWQTDYGATAFTLSISNIPITLGFGTNSTPLWTSNGFNLMLQGPIGSNYVILASTNLVNWTPITNFVIFSWPFYFSDAAATNYNQQFYRALMP